MTRETSKRVASKASAVLRDDDTSSRSKSAGGSALSQKDAPRKATSAKTASKASATLRDGRTSDESKSAAGSALSQKRRRG